MGIAERASMMGVLGTQGGFVFGTQGGFVFGTQGGFALALFQRSKILLENT